MLVESLPTFLFRHVYGKQNVTEIGMKLRTAIHSPEGEKTDAQSKSIVERSAFAYCFAVLSRPLWFTPKIQNTSSAMFAEKAM